MIEKIDAQIKVLEKEEEEREGKQRLVYDRRVCLWKVLISHI